MRPRLAAAALAGVLLTASCGGSGSEGAEGEVAGLEAAPVDVLVSGVVAAGTAEHASLRIEQILWERGPHRDEDGTLVIPAKIDTGDTIDLAAPDGLEAGSRYIVLANQETTPPGDPLLSVFGVIDPITNAMVVPFSPAPMELMLPGESGLVSELDALVELLRDSARFHGAKSSPRPLTRRLAHAFQLAEERSGGAVTLGDGVAMEDYLLLAGDRRTIPPGSELPDVVVESLGVRVFQARVLLPEGFADRHWAIALQSKAGIVGPIELAPGQTTVDVEGFRARGAPLRLVAWETDPGPTSALAGTAQRVGKKGLREALTEVSRTLKPRFLLVVDVPTGEVTIDKSVASTEAETA